MQKVVLLINPEHTAKAKIHLQTFNTGSFVVPTIFRINIKKEEIKAAVDAFEYILTDIDFHFIALRESSTWKEFKALIPESNYY